MMLRNRIIAAAALLAGACTQGPSPIAPDPLLRCTETQMRAAVAAKDKSKPLPDRGTGGTGLFAADTTNGDRGIGGTGIVGTLTGFGSICVNGFRIAYDDSTPITIDGVPSAPERLARGQTVIVTAVDVGGALSAQSVLVQSALIGPVTALRETSSDGIASSESSIAVMGQTVVIESSTVVSGGQIKVGDIVVISGLQRADGTIVATRLEAQASNAPALVRGYVTAVADDVITVGAVPVQRGAGAEPVAVGAWMMAKGEWSGNLLKARSSTVGAEIPDASARLSVEGFVVAAPGGGYVVRGVPVTANVRVGLDGPTIARLTGPTRVQVLGNVEQSRSVRPSTIVVPEVMNPMAGQGVRPAGVAPTPPPWVQELRGTYGHPLDPAMRPEGLPERPSGAQRPNVTPPIERPNVPVRPETPVRPGIPSRPGTPTRPGVGG